LTASAMRHPRWSTGHRAVRLMRHHAQNRDDRDAFLLALGQLWSAGIDVDWTPLRGGHRPQLVSLPGYPFERQRHWVDHKPSVWSAADAAVQIHGGNGFALEFPVSRLLCDARVLSIFEGASEIQAQVIAKRLLEN